MSYSQTQLGRRFFNGAVTGKSSNVELVETDEEVLVVGYGHAVYAARDKDTGETTYYSGWYGYSQSTSSQISKMRLKKCDKTVQKKRQL